jgi:NADP-dependent 3-hydroxy acid dehydrogenase YdfG
VTFRNQVVWITGASSGVGEGLAVAFGEAGARVVLSARRQEELERVALDRMGSAETLVLPMDVTDYASLPAKVAAVRERFGRVDMLICNAGISHRCRFCEMTLDTFRRIIEVDLLAPVAHVQAVLPVMRHQKAGHIVVTSSVAGKFGIPNRSAYCTAKHGLHGFCDSLRAEERNNNIRVSTLVIAAVRSAVFENSLLGNGQRYGKASAGGGMDAAEAGRHMLRQLAAGKSEVLCVANWRAGLPLWLQRLRPQLVHARMARLAQSKYWA